MREETGQKIYRMAYHTDLCSPYLFDTQYEVFGRLVPLGFDIAAFTPAAYQRGSLPRPYKEISS